MQGPFAGALHTAGWISFIIVASSLTTLALAPFFIAERTGEACRQAGAEERVALGCDKAPGISVWHPFPDAAFQICFNDRGKMVACPGAGHTPFTAFK